MQFENSKLKVTRQQNCRIRCSLDRSTTCLHQLAVVKLFRPMLKYATAVIIIIIIIAVLKFPSPAHQKHGVDLRMV